jgi:hypothetical protein
MLERKGSRSIPTLTGRKSADRLSKRRDARREEKKKKPA